MQHVTRWPRFAPYRVGCAKLRRRGARTAPDKRECQHAMLNEVLSWWLRQMLGLIPRRWRGGGAGPGNALVIAWNEAANSAELFARREHREASLGRVALDEAGLRRAGALIGSRRAYPTVLRLPPGLLLERQVTLPLAAEQGLERVVRHEMDRFTPFAADDVFFAASVQRRDRAQGKLTVGIAVVPRDRLAGVLAALRAARLVPDLLEAAGFGTGVRRIPLGAAVPARGRWRRAGFALGGAACAGLAVAAAALPFWLQQSASDAVEARIALLQPRVQEAEALRRRIALAAAGSDAVGAERARVGDALYVIAKLTVLLADDTYLMALSMQKRDLTLDGQAPAAAQLLTSLSADPAIRNAAFAAPVTRGETGADLFSIKAEIAP